MAQKENRNPITLACTVCNHAGYHTTKNRRNNPNRLELKKFCPVCRSHQLHRERK